MAARVLFMLALGIYMTEIMLKDAPNHLEVYNLHKSFGVMVLILVVIRIINRLIYKAPPLPGGLLKWEKIASHLGHFGLYVLMIFVPLSGYLMSNFFGFPVHFFQIEMPFLVERNFELGRLFSELHQLLAYLLLALVIIHVLAVIKHRFFDKPENDVLQRMI